MYLEGSVASPWFIREWIPARSQHHNLPLRMATTHTVSRSLLYKLTFNPSIQQGN
jgi:hypothetical protein